MEHILTLKRKSLEIWSHAGFQKYFRNTGWMFFAQLFNIISLILNIWIARYLGPENFGIISYVFAFVGIFGFLTNLGINEILIRDLVRYPEKRDKLMGTCFFLMLLGGILSFILVSTLAIIFEGNYLIKYMIILYSTVALFAPFNVISSYFQSRVEAKKNALLQIIVTALVSVFKIMVIVLNKGIIWFILCFVLDYLIGAIIHVINFKRSGLKFLSWEFDFSLAKKILSVSYLLMLSGMTGFLLMKFDQVMIKHFLDETAVGLYAAAVRLSEIWYFIPGIIAASLFPAIVNAKKTNTESYKSRIKKLFILLISVAIIISIVISVIAPFLVNVLYGAEYQQSISILRIYAWSNVGWFSIIVINKFLMIEDRFKEIFLYGLFSVILNIMLNTILIPKLNLTGAAISTLISYVIIPIFFFVRSQIVNYEK